MKKTITIDSITTAHEVFDLGKPKHPLITFFPNTPSMITGFLDVRLAMELYVISMKDGVTGSFQYGRNAYDFEEGVLTFLSPGQLIVPGDARDIDNKGWSIMFHPDLIRKSPLGQSIDRYTFFGYEVFEALYLSDGEKQALNELAKKIDTEIDQNIDRHTQKLIVSNLSLLLDYCTRYYDRQFYTRSDMHQDTITQFEAFLKSYFMTGQQLELGLPSVKYCSAQLHMSPNYLSDLLKKETGRSAQDHIHSFIVEKAKTILLTSSNSITQVASGLGFEYSQHFSRLFKAKTGMSPSEYRKLN